MNILENQQLAEPVDGIYIDLEAQILQNIARHLQGWEQPIDTDRWLMQKLADIGKLNQENIRLIAKMSGLSQTAAERMLMKQHRMLSTIWNQDSDTWQGGGSLRKLYRLIRART